MEMKKTKREFLKAVGVAGATIGTASFSASAKDENKVGLRDAGIEQPVMDAIKSGNSEKAKELLESHNVNYSHISTEVKPENEDNSHENENSTQVEPDAIYKSPDWDGSNSKQDLFTTYLGDHIHRFSLSMDLEIDEINVGFDTAGPSDGMAISYSEEPYRTLPDTSATSPRVSVSDTNPHGVKAKFNDTPIATTPYLAIDVEERLENGEWYSGSTTVYSDFIHSWNPGGLPSNFGISFSLTAAGSFSANVSGFVERAKSENQETHTVI